MPRQAMVSLVSTQPNFPAPKITLTICARKIKIKMLIGIIKKSVCLKAFENFCKNFSSSACKKAIDIEGKIAVERERATVFTKIDDKLFAKLNTAIEPAIKVEAIAVITMVFNWPAARPKDLGAISFIVFITPSCLKLKFNLYLNPEKINAGICIERCKTPPKTTPHASPTIPIFGTKNEIPIIIPILYIMGASAVTKNLWNTCKIPLIIFEAPKIIGLKNIIRISKIAISLFSPEKPGAVKDKINGVKIIKNMQTIIKNPKNILKSAETYSHASSFDFTIYELKTGIIAADIAPKIKIKAIKSGMVKAV